MPNVKRVTAISIWMTICILFSFFALAAYAFVLFKLKPQLLQKTWSYPLRRGTSGKIGIVGGRDSSFLDPTVSKTDNRKVLRLDSWFLVAFPTAFCISHVLYWSICLSAKYTPESSPISYLHGLKTGSNGTKQFLY